MSDSSKKSSLPAWQQNNKTEVESTETELPHASDPTTQLPHTELLEQAREFLKTDSIRDAPLEKKVAFLEAKGLKSSDIEQLMREEQAEQTKELRTVHDSNKTEEEKVTTPTESSGSEASLQTQEPIEKSPRQVQRDMPPIITYPEFLIKPQKPPPLITIPRLINAAYVFGGLATLTYGASKYIVEPMIETLTEARHSLASTTLEDLEKLNDKLESTVSHIPYIASAAARKSQEHNRGDGDDEDNDSVTSDPTELFHRDIATQTTPSLSRTQSYNDDREHLDATTQQVMRLSSLNDTLTSLAEALDPKEVPYLPAPANKKLRETISDFQTVLDKLETTYNPLRGDYYSTIYAQPADSKSKGGKDNDITSKVRAEIRNLKGAFLSARNFPTAPRPASMYTSR